MELHPILEKGIVPNPGLWYVLTTSGGECPSPRVGHTCSYLPGPQGHSGTVYFVGGADPDRTYADTFALNLDTFLWSKLDVPGLRARYEHFAFVSSTSPNLVFVFGGADQNRNHNDLQVFDAGKNADSDRLWKTINLGSSSATAPSPRTYHGSTTLEPNADYTDATSFAVYGGGQNGSDPVGDRQIHRFDVGTKSWSTSGARGEAPKPRHGHLVLAVGGMVFVHGGMAGQTFYDDLYFLDSEGREWHAMKRKKAACWPSARAAHGGIVFGKDFYVFGGMNRDGAMDDLYKFDTVSKQWTQVKSDGPSPACRLDFACCSVRLRVPLDSAETTTQDLLATSKQAKEVLDDQLRLGSAGSGRSFGSAGSTRSRELLTGVEERESTANGDNAPTNQNEDVSIATAESTNEMNDALYKTVSLLLLHGGMDTEGQIFDDCLVFAIEDDSSH